VAKAARALAVVLDEAVAVAIAVALDPLERRFDVRPDRLQRFLVARPLPVHTGQSDEQRRRVDRAVIAAEGHFAQPRELAFAHLVQDLAWLPVGAGVLVVGLVRGGETQSA